MAISFSIKGNSKSEIAFAAGPAHSLSVLFNKRF